MNACCMEKISTDIRSHCNTDGSSKLSNCLCCGEKLASDASIGTVANSLDYPDVPSGKLKKSNILDKLHLKLNKLHKLNAQVKKCNEDLESSSSIPGMKQFKSKQDFEEFLTKTYNDKRYSYCIINCQPTEVKRHRKPFQITNNRIPRNMGWNWKLNHDKSWQPGSLPKVIKMRMSHFLNYYPCDTLPISRINIKLSKSSFDESDIREAKIKKMIHSIGFSPCSCNKSVAWCMCREKSEMKKLKNFLEQIEQQIGESGLEYKLYLNESVKDDGRKMSSFEKRGKSIPDLVCQETQYETTDFKYLQPTKNSKRNAASAKLNNSVATIPEEAVSSANNSNTRKSGKQI